MIWFIVLLPVLIPGFNRGFFSVLPLIMSAAGLLVILALYVNKRGCFPVPKHLFWVVVFLLFSLASVSLSIFLHNFFTFGEQSEVSSRLLYIARPLMIYTIFILVFLLLLRSRPDPEVLLEKFSRAVILIVLVGVIVEVFSKLSGFSLFIDLYKEREDLGGVDSVHYSRLSGFFAYPGDLAAVCVLALCLIRYAGWKKKAQMIGAIIIFISLLYTQSRNGLIFFMCIFFLQVINDKKIALSFLFFMFFLGSAAYIFSDHLVGVSKSFSYVWKFYEEFEYYAYESKRAREIIGVLDAGFYELLFGLDGNNIHNFYESEWAGSIARVGLVGSLWLFFILFAILYFFITSRRVYGGKLFLLTNYLVCYILIYSLGSAGFSRPKILIFATSLLAVLLYIHVFCKQKKLRGRLQISQAK